MDAELPSASAWRRFHPRSSGTYEDPDEVFAGRITPWVREVRNIPTLSPPEIHRLRRKTF